MNQQLAQLRAEITKYVADYVADVRKMVIPELWLSMGVTEDSLIIEGVEHHYKGDGSDNILMLMEFMIEIPEHLRRAKIDAANIREGMEAVLANKKAITFPVTA